MRKVALALALLLLAGGLYLAFGPGMRKAQGDSGDAMAAKAVQDLAGRLGISEEEIAVETLEETTWPDASLGYPEPGMFYAQVLTPGYKIILRAKGNEYEYHTDKNRVVKMCPEEQMSKRTAPALRVAYLKEPARSDPNLNLELWLLDLVSGEEHCLATGVSEFRFSPDRGKLALIGRTSRSGLELSLAKGDGAERKPYWTCVAISAFVWAPDGEHFAFLAREELDHYDWGVVMGSLKEAPPSGPVYLPPGEKKMVRGELSWDSASSTVILNAYSNGAKCDVWAIPLESRQPKLVIQDCEAAEPL